jgi:hypothetical protein
LPLGLLDLAIDQVMRDSGVQLLVPFPVQVLGGVPLSELFVALPPPVPPLDHRPRDHREMMNRGHELHSVVQRPVARLEGGSPRVEQRSELGSNERDPREASRCSLASERSEQSERAERCGRAREVSPGE